MKKVVLGIAVALFVGAAASAQVLERAQIKNTLWTGFGNPFDGDTMFYGFTDIFQARFDQGKFTMDGMLNMGALANYENGGDVDNFEIGTTNLNPLALHYGRNTRGGNHTNTNNDGYDNAINSNNTITDAFYLNFVYHINRNFDFGMGTKLNWKVGPAPGYGDWVWGPNAHVRQGGFSTAYDDRSGSFYPSSTSSDCAGYYKFKVDAPGTADVVGFIPYSNSYARRGLGVRYVSKGKMNFEAGAAIPNGFNTDDPAVNFGVKFAPVNWVSIGAVMEGAFEDAANFYAGSTIGAKNFLLEVYLAMDSLFTKEKDDEAYGIGGAITFSVPNSKLSLRPEAGLNFFENDDYTFAWYAGAALIVPINKDFLFNAYGSLAFGSKDKDWDDDDWNGGHIFTIRPSVKYKFSKKTDFDLNLNLENRKAFDGKTRNAWSCGFYVSHIL